jgi:hypothetical protein
MDSYYKLVSILAFVYFAVWFASLGKSQISSGTVESAKTFLTGMVNDFVRSVMESLFLKIMLLLSSILGLGGLTKVIKHWQRTARRYRYIRRSRF